MFSTTETSTGCSLVLLVSVLIFVLSDSKAVIQCGWWVGMGAVARVRGLLRAFLGLPLQGALLPATLSCAPLLFLDSVHAVFSYLRSANCGSCTVGYCMCSSVGNARLTSRSHTPDACLKNCGKAAV